MSTCEARLFVPKGRFIAYVSGMTVDEIFCPPLHCYFVFYCFCRFNTEKARKEIVTSSQKGKNWTIVQTYVKLLHIMTSSQMGKNSTLITIFALKFY
jgi:hypothetical protein